jgi:hypothetical protein
MLSQSRVYPIMYSVYTFWISYVYKTDPPSTMSGLYAIRVTGTIFGVLAILTVLGMILEKKNATK